jgi:hypothetical protein
MKKEMNGGSAEQVMKWKFHETACPPAAMNRNKIAVEGFKFENFKLPVLQRMRLAGGPRSDSTTQGAKTISLYLYDGLPLPNPMNELKHEPIPLMADQNAQRLLTRNGFSLFSSFLWKSIMMLFLFSAAWSAQAQDYLVGVRGGASLDNHPGYFRQTEVFASRYLPWDWNTYLGLSFKPRVEASMGWLEGGSQNGVVGTMGPVIELREGKFPVTLEGGVSLSGLSRYKFNDKDLGGWFEFTDHIGVNWHVTKCFTLGVRFQHMSNASLYKHNPGLNLEMLSASYSF